MIVQFGGIFWVDIVDIGMTTSVLYLDMYLKSTVGWLEEDVSGRVQWGSFIWSMINAMCSWTGGLTCWLLHTLLPWRQWLESERSTLLVGVLIFYFQKTAVNGNFLRHCVFSRRQAEDGWAVPTCDTGCVSWWAFTGMTSTKFMRPFLIIHSTW